MDIRILYFTICFCLLSNGKSWAQMQDDAKLELYLLMGQSNMAGRGPVTNDIKDKSHERVYVFTKEKTWVIAKHPIHFDKPGIAAVGPGLSFGIRMAEAYPDKHIGLVPCAVGGTSIEKWQPSAYDTVTKTHPYDDAIERIKAAMAFGTIKGVIWHQGEANSTPEKASIYLSQLKELIIRVRRLVDDPELPFIAGELGRFYKGADNINNQLKELPSLVNNVAVVASDGLMHKGDEVHFDGASADELGKRYAALMLQVQKRKSSVKYKKGKRN